MGWTIIGAVLVLAFAAPALVTGRIVGHIIDRLTRRP